MEETPRSPLQEEEDLEPGGIAEDLEKVGDVNDGLLWGECETLGVQIIVHGHSIATREAKGKSVYLQNMDYGIECNNSP